MEFGDRLTTCVQSRHARNLPVNGQIVLVPNNQQHFVVGQAGAHVAFDLCRIIDEHTQNVTICRTRERRSNISYQVNKPYSYNIFAILYHIANLEISTNELCESFVLTEHDKCGNCSICRSIPRHYGQCGGLAEVACTIYTSIANPLGQALKYRSSGRQYKIKCKTKAKTGREKPTGKQK